MAGDLIRVGVVGLGRSGWDIHADALAQLAGFEVTAVADPLPERRAEAVARFGCVAYDRPEDLLDDDDVEVAVIATPSHTHVPLALAALEAGRHVVVEKPMAQSAAEVDLLIAAAEKAGRVVTCFQNARLDPTFLAVQDVIASGRLGDLVLIRRTSHRFARRADWQTLRKYGGGELANTGSHFVDQVLLLLGDGPVEVFADLRRVVSAGDAEDHVKLCLRTESGPTADVECSRAVATPQPSWLVAGTTGGLVSVDGGLVVRWFDPAGLDELEVDEGAAPQRQYGTDERIDWREETVAVDDAVETSGRAYYERLARTLRHGAELFVTPESVRRQIDVIERARQPQRV